MTTARRPKRPLMTLRSYKIWDGQCTALRPQLNFGSLGNAGLVEPSSVVPLGRNG